MLDILPPDHLAHHMLLVEAVYLLLKNMAELSKAEVLIKHFALRYSITMESVMSANVHHLLHLPQVVHDFDPLYCYSCFAYEG